MLTVLFGQVSDSFRLLDVCVDSLIPGLEAPQPQRHSGQPERIAASMPDSFTGEASLLGCDLLTHTSAGSQPVSALPCSFSSGPPGCGSGSCLEDLQPSQAAGKPLGLHPSV
uniref:Uncharacterized protein n=1 Tax=Poecilia latipinna TaxID=48699 RepID=A0A3B3W0Y2_9TELE